MSVSYKFLHRGPLAGETPETEAVMEEFRRLRDALDHILSEEKS